MDARAPNGDQAASGVSPERAPGLIVDLVALVAPHFPVVVANATVETNPWLVVGPSLLARAVSTVESISRLSSLRRDADPLSLVRDLLETATNFAWIAANPIPRIDAWEKADMDHRLNFDDDLRGFGTGVLDPAWRAELERRLEPQRLPFPKLAVRAKEADEHWGTRIPQLQQEPEAGHVFRFLYAGIFRYASGFTHSLPVAVNRLVEDAGTSKVVVLEGTSGSQRGLTFAPIAFGLMLYVAAESLAWPRKADVDTTFGRHLAGIGFST